MKKTWKWIFPLMFGFLLAGCAGVQAPAKIERGYGLDYGAPSSPMKVSTSSVVVSRAQAYAKGNVLMVVGSVKRPHEIQLPGHLDLLVCSSEGDLLDHETALVRGLSSNRKGMMELPFAFRVGGLPPEGAQIRLRYHAPVAGDTSFHRCT